MAWYSELLIWRRLAALEGRMDEMEASQSQDQAAIDQVTAELGSVRQNVDQLQTNLADSRTKLQAEIDQLAASGSSPANLSALQAVADELGQHVTAAEQAASDLGSLAPTPAPAPVPAVESVGQPEPPPSA